MILGAMLACGLDADALKADLARLNLTGYQLDIQQVKKQGIAATKFDVKVEGDHGHRHLHHITKIIDAADLPARVKDRAKAVFTRLGHAEAKIHGTTIEKVHFHEVGAVDAIIDIVGAAIGLERLGIDRLVCSPIPTGSGTVTCEHGVMPVPAPATAELLAGVPIAPCDEMGELTTPTGAAILATLCTEFGPLPPMRIDRVGYSAGTRDGKRRPNVLRLILGSAIEGDAEHDEVVLLEANLDDCTGEQIGYAVDRLFEAGALEVFNTAISMKKSRPGVVLSVIAPIEKESDCERVLFAETSTFGVRRSLRTRRKLGRRIDAVATRYGEIRVKIGTRGEEVVRVAPEFEDCAKAAREHGVPLADVTRIAIEAWRSNKTP